MWDEKTLNKEIRKIPIENLPKFALDLKTLVLNAQKEDYENYSIK